MPLNGYAQMHVLVHVGVALSVLYEMEKCTNGCCWHSVQQGKMVFGSYTIIEEWCLYIGIQVP